MRFYLCIFWVIWIAYMIFVREASDLSLVSLDPCSIHHSFCFGCDYFPCFDAGWPSLTFLFLYLLLSLFYSFISPSLIRFISFLILLDVWLGFSIHTLFLLIRCVHSFIITFRVGTPRSGTQDVSMHCISCMRGMRIISLGNLSLVSFHFFHLITLAYITSHVWRPSWGHDFTLCLTAHMWAILELGQRLFLGAWWMGSWDDDSHWGIPLLSVMDFQRWCYLHWGIPCLSMTVS